ncbi:hypothetical protein F4604DRAFT_1689095 [Suillus subluteus]|nr:hypothetical protein F4604DRAFT_1689095 [Suillus subluteus]
MTTILGEGGPKSAIKHGPCKRAYQYSLLDELDEPGDDGYFPTKKSKTLFTSFTCHHPADSMVYFMEWMLELSCVSRQTFAAKMEYQHLCTKELGLIMAIIQDELEEYRGHLKHYFQAVQLSYSFAVAKILGLLLSNLLETYTAALLNQILLCNNATPMLKLPSNTLVTLFTLMPRSSGRGHGHSVSRVQATIPDIEHTGSTSAFQPIPFQHNPTSSNSTIERLASAAAMIQPSDVKGIERARWCSKIVEPKPTNMKYYSNADQKNIKHAHKLLILDMLLESGWQKTSELELVAAECISQVSDMSGHITQSTEGINKLIFDGLSMIRGKLVNEAERVLSSLNIYLPDDSSLSDNKKIEYIKEHATQLLDDNNLAEYSLHGFWFGQNLPFLDPQARALILCISWYMYSLMGTVNYVASTTAKLYWRPSTNQPALILTSSSSSFQSSTFDYPNIPVALSLSSSGTSWNPPKDYHDPIAPKPMPFQYYPPQYLSSGEHHPADTAGSLALSHYSPSEHQYQLYWNANSSGGRQTGDFQQQLVTNNPLMSSSHGFNVDPNQYFMGNSSSSWGGGGGYYRLEQSHGISKALLSRTMLENNGLGATHAPLP